MSIDRGSCTDLNGIKLVLYDEAFLIVFEQIQVYYICAFLAIVVWQKFQYLENGTIFFWTTCVEIYQTLAL